MTTESETAAIAVTAATATTASLLWVLIVLAVILISCFGCGATIVYMMKKTTPQTPIEILKKKGGKLELSVDASKSNMSVSQADLGPQYHPKMEDMCTIDIFASKKRAMKKVDDDVLFAYDNAGEVHDQAPAANFGTEKKLLIGLGEQLGD